MWESPRRSHLAAALIPALGAAGQQTTELLFSTFIPLFLAHRGMSATFIGLASTLDTYRFALLSATSLGLVSLCMLVPARSGLGVRT